MAGIIDTIKSAIIKKQLISISPSKESKDQKGYSIQLIKVKGIDKEIPTVRCDNCLQYLSLFEVEIDKGDILGDLICPNCGTNNNNISIDKRVIKGKKAVFVGDPEPEIEDGYKPENMIDRRIQ